MSNSKLATYAKLSPNCTKPRNHAIDTVSIHCMAGNLSVESCGNGFAPSSRQASSNYGIGSDGRIAVYVDEVNRSWCTSSPENDHRAVTIEVANDGGAPDWHVSDKAMASLIALLEDVCRRNNIRKLLWSGDKSLVGRVDKQNMTVHRWFAAKSCPGNYLFGKHGYIAAEVNKRLGTAVSPSKTVSESYDETVWRFLKGKGLNDYAVAGLIGNLYAESLIKPNNVQNSSEKGLGMTDEEYTASVDNGTYKNFARDRVGYGICQWTEESRKEALFNFAKKAKESIGDITMQLAFLWDELQRYPAVMRTLNSADSVRSSSDAVLLDFERPADMSEAVKVKRAGFGQGYYDKFAAVDKPYTVRVTGNPLNIRKGPGTSYGTNGSITDNGVYTVVEEADGPGAKKWGKLKSGAGWISLDFTSKV